MYISPSLLASLLFLIPPPPPLSLSLSLSLSLCFSIQVAESSSNLSVPKKSRWNFLSRLKSRNKIAPSTQPLPTTTSAGNVLTVPTCSYFIQHIAACIMCLTKINTMILTLIRERRKCLNHAPHATTVKRDQWWCTVINW